MNQHMHNWIATVLGILTVKLLFPQHKFNAITNDFDLIIFIVDWSATIILMGSLFYIMVDNNDFFMYPWYTLYAIAMCGVAISYYVKVYILGHKL